MEWRGCNLVYAQSFEMYEPGLDKTFSFSHALTVPLAQIVRVDRHDEREDGALMTFLLHKNEGAVWMARGIAADGKPSEEDLTEVAVQVESAIADRVEKAITHLAKLCGAQIKREVF